jgi:hypothetical protein
MVEKPDCRDRETYILVTLHLEDIFRTENNELRRIKELARNIEDGIEKLSPFIQQTTASVCPRCTDVCCISKHGYYDYDDLVYISALGLKLPPYDFGRKDSDPCQFLSGRGCSLKRTMRPSGCNWYFCENLLEEMEQKPGYRAFDDSLRDAAHLWIEMIEAFFGFSTLRKR